MLLLFISARMLGGFKKGRACRGLTASGVWPYDITDPSSFEPVTDHDGEISKGFDKKIGTYLVYIGLYFAFAAYVFVIMTVFSIMRAVGKCGDVEVSDLLPVMKPSKVSPSVTIQGETL